MSDEALVFFRADAKRLGISEAEYERRFGVILRSGGPAAQRIRRNEVLGGLMHEDDLGRTALGERIRQSVRDEDWEAQKEAGGT
jgi:hypothetical protein